MARKSKTNVTVDAKWNFTHRVSDFVNITREHIESVLQAARRHLAGMRGPDVDYRRFRVARWVSQKVMSGETIREMTPDNSWRFLERPEPLVVLLLSVSGGTGHERETRENIMAMQTMQEVAQHFGEENLQVRGFA